MILVTDIACALDREPDTRGGCVQRKGYLVQCVARTLGLPAEQVAGAEVVRRSIDARRKGDVHFVVSAAVGLTSAELEAALVADGAARAYLPYEALAVEPVEPHVAQTCSPVVVGTGPAGLFAALYLARAGLNPVVVERGPSVERRTHAVERFVAAGRLDENANIQFGEGGAGAFSDGKLTTNIKHPFATHVLHWFAEAGAPSEVLWQAKPHIGSDLLPGVVAAMRNEVLERGGTVLFDTQLEDVLFEDGRVAAAVLGPTAPGGGKAYTVPCTHLVVACGHSARDTFQMLFDRGLALEQKPFSVGVRIEHAQDSVNRAQWGRSANHPALGAADYKLAVHLPNGRSVYTFCMCPGGEVLCAASEEGGVATNGASPFARDGANANAAVLVNVDPADFGDLHPLAGVEFQRRIERAAFACGRAQGAEPYAAPIQRVGSFLQAAASTGAPFASGSASQQAGLVGQAGHVERHRQVQPSYARGTFEFDLREVLPDFVCDALAQALPLMGKKLAGFDDPDAILTAPETRSSSPVRICRASDCQAWLALDPGQSGCGVYPAGEGAGYAGGIMSAACDGLRVAQAVADDVRARLAAGGDPAAAGVAGTGTIAAETRGEPSFFGVGAEAKEGLSPCGAAAETRRGGPGVGADGRGSA